MTTPAGDRSRESQRLSSAPSLVQFVAESVIGLHVVPREQMPVRRLTLPTPEGWLTGHYTGDDPMQPWRVVVCGQQADGGWGACETITAFAFTGVCPDEILLTHADATLRAFDAVEVCTIPLTTPDTPSNYGVRSSGYFSAMGLWLWGHYSYYLWGSAAGRGRLIAHCLFAEADRRDELSWDLDLLTTAAQNAFLSWNEAL